MTFARKLAIACIAGALAVGALFILLMRGREASREAAPGEIAAAVETVEPALAPIPVQKPSAAPRARKETAAPTARVAVAAFEDGGWLILGRLVRPLGSPPPRVSPDQPPMAESLPVEGVRLLLRGHPRKTRPGEAPPPRQIVTGPDGTFAFENVPGRIALRLEIEGEGWADRAFSFRLEEPDYGARMDLGDIPLEPGSTLVVELAGPDGSLVPGGRVLVGRRSGGKTDELERLGFNDSRREASDAGEGRYVLERAAPGPHRIEALAPRFAPGREEVVLPQEEPVRIGLEEGGRIAGTIRSTEEKPIDTASVEVNGSGVLEPPPVVAAEKDGSYLVDFLGTGNYALTAMADGYASVLRNGVPPGSEGIDFELEKEAVLEGKVVAEGANTPVEGARISLEGAKVPVTAVSDKAGAFTLRKIATGSYRLVVDHPEYAPHRDEAPFEAAAGEELPKRTVRLGSGIILRGKVVNAEAGEPVPGATVRLTPAGQGGASGRKRAAADDQGAFEARALAQGAYEVIASARGYLPSTRTSVNVGPEGAEDVEIVLEKASSISGTVLDPGGRPVRGAQIRPNLGQTNNFSWGDNRIFDSLQRAVAETDAEGRFTLEGVHAFPVYVLRATHPDHASAMSAAIAVGPRQSVEGIEITLGRAGELRGRVVDEKGNPLRGASVSASPSQGGPSLMYDTEGSPSAQTGADGKFELRRLAGGAYTVRATAKDREAAVRQDVGITPGEPGEELEITLGPGVSLAGKVVDESGAPIAGVTIQHWGTGNVQATSGPDGLFEMKGLTAGPLELQVSKAGYARAQLQTAAPGKDLEVRLERAAKVSGTVRTRSGEPVAGADVMSIPRGAAARSYYGGSSARTSPSGTYELEVAKGTWALRANAPGRPAGTSSEIEVAPGETRENVDIELPEGCAIDGYVFLAGSGAPVENATISSSVQSSDPWGQSSGNVATRSDGYFLLEGVPEGEVTVTAAHPDYAPGTASGIQAKVGAKVSVRIELRAGGAVRGRALRAGSPVASGWATARPRSAGATQRNTQTGPDGTFEIKGLAPGDYIIVVEENGRSGPQLRRSVTVIEGQTIDIDLEGGAGVRLSGRIISRDGTVGEGRVEALRLDQGVEGGSRSQISPGGEFSLDLPGPGTYTLMVGFGPGGGVKVDVVVPAGSPEVRQDIELPSGRVTGTVVNASTGQPVGSVEVGAFLAGGRGSSILSLYRSMQVMGRSDDTGRFVLSNLPEGSYDIRAFANGYVQVRRASIQIGASGASRELKVELETSLSFSARAEDSGGRPLSGALALLRDAEGELVLSGSPARSGGDGMLDVQGVVPGTYRITVSHQAHAAARAVITVLEDGSVSPQPIFRLAKGGKIRVRVASGREPVDGATAEVIDDAGDDLMNDAGFFIQETPLATGPDGLLELGPFPAGVYKVSVTKDGRRSKVEKVAVREGETAEERFTLE